MRQVKRWRYYCDFCRKAGGSAYYMKKHEAGCTLNPGRQCGMCSLHGDVNAKPLAELITIFAPANDYEALIPERLAQLRKDADGCPACIFAALRQSNAIEYVTVDQFDLRKERAAFMDRVNEIRREYDAVSW
jgi:hypothetical protein